MAGSLTIMGFHHLRNQQEPQNRLPQYGHPEMSKIQINLTRTIAAAEDAFKESCFLLGREFTEVISEVGAFPEHPDRDLVDTGRLRASQTLDFPERGKAVFSWNTDYAIYQHSGFTMRNGQQWEGRPWTRLGMERLNFQNTYAKLLESKLNQ